MSYNLQVLTMWLLIFFTIFTLLCLIFMTLFDKSKQYIMLKNL